MRDTLPENGAKKYECGCVNLSVFESKGTHWVCYSTFPKELVYFDSYGLPPPLEIVQYLRKNGRENVNLWYSTFKLQTKIDPPICGHLCLFLLKKLSTKTTFFDALLDMCKLKKENKLVSELLYT